MGSGMLTRNYYNLLTTHFAGAAGVNTTQEPAQNEALMWLRKGDGTYATQKNYYPININLFDNNPAVNRTPVYITSYKTLAALNAEGNVGVQLGTGDSALSYDDYKLAEPLYTGFTVSGKTLGTPVYDVDQHAYIITNKFVLLWSGEEAITIKEFGLFKPLYADSSSYPYPVLVYRELLSNPITVEQNDNIEIQFKQIVPVMNYTPYPELVE